MEGGGRYINRPLLAMIIISVRLLFFNAFVLFFTDLGILEIYEAVLKCARFPMGSST